MFRVTGVQARKHHGYPRGREALLSLALMTVAGAHVPVVRDHAAENFWVGFLFAGFVATVGMLSIAVLVNRSNAVLVLVLSYMLLAVAMYVTTRSTSVVWFEDDRGAWSSPAPWVQLSVVSELVTAVLATWILAGTDAEA